MATPALIMAVVRASLPSFRNSSDKMVFVVHASFLASGHFLTAVGPAALSDSALSSSSSDEVGIDHWNDLEKEYAFVYEKSDNNDSSKKVLVKCFAFNNWVLVDALRCGADGVSDEPLHLAIDARKYDGENDETNYSMQFKNFDALVRDLNEKILLILAGSDVETINLLRAERENPLQPGQEVAYFPGTYRFPFPSGHFFRAPVAWTYPTRDNFSGGGILIGPYYPRFGVDGQPCFPAELPPGLPPGALFGPIVLPGFPAELLPDVPPGGLFGPNTTPGVEVELKIIQDLKQPPGG